MCFLKWPHFLYFRIIPYHDGAFLAPILSRFIKHHLTFRIATFTERRAPCTMRSPPPETAAPWSRTSLRGSGKLVPSCPPSATPPPSSWSRSRMRKWTAMMTRFSRNRYGLTRILTLSRTLCHKQSDQSSNVKYCCLQKVINLHTHFTGTSVSQNFIF